MTLFIVRHGETIENKMGIIQGHHHGTLTENGIEQAKKLGKRLKDKKFDRVYCSDLNRTRDTCAKIVKYHPGTEVEYTEQAREYRWGSYQGKKRDDVDLENPPADAETTDEVARRASHFITGLYNKHKEKKILIVSHGGFINAMLSNLLSEEIAKANDYQKQENTALNVVRMTGCHNQLLVYNDASHLK